MKSNMGEWERIQTMDKQKPFGILFTTGAFEKV